MKKNTHKTCKKIGAKHFTATATSNKVLRGSLMVLGFSVRENAN